MKSALPCWPRLNPKRAGNFVDNCTTFDSSLWKKADWAMGQGSGKRKISPVACGVLNFKVPANTTTVANLFVT